MEAEPASGPRRRRSSWAPLAVLALIVAIGAALRLGYFLNGDPFVDEWATMLVARSIWERGLPILPSGTLYGHGMLYSYLDALVLGLLGWSPVVAQLPSLIAGLLTIPLAYIVGRQLFPSGAVWGGLATMHRGSSTALNVDAGPQGIAAWRGEAVGLLAAAVLAFDPVAVLWAGRARAYTLEQIAVLLAILALGRRRYLLFALAFVAAVATHTETSLLLPGFALGALLLEGWPVVRRPRVWLAFGLCAAAVVAQYLIHRLIVAGSGRQFQTIDSRPAFQPTLDLIASIKPLLPYFGEAYRLPITLLFVAGLVFGFRAWRRRAQDPQSDLDRGVDGYLLLYPLCLVTLLIMLTVVGESWRDPRYLFMLFPAFALLAGATAVDLMAVLAARPGVPAWLKGAGVVALVAFLVVPPLPEALDTAEKLEEGYGPTLAYVRERLQPGDQVAGWAVPAILMELGQIDHFAMQIRHQEFIMQRDGVWVDRWAGAPLMDSVEQLQAALDQPGRLWFLTDEFRFRARYTPEFAQAVWDGMEPVYRYHYALAFLERPAAEPAYHRDLQASFDHGLDLVGYDLVPASLESGEQITVTLHWQARDWVDQPYTTFVHLSDPSGQGVAQVDGPPFQGLHPTDHWLTGERLQDVRHLAVPDGAPPGRYRLEVGWYDPATLERLPLVGGGDALTLAYLPLGQEAVAAPGVAVNAELDGQVELVGYDLWRESGGQWVPLGEGQPLTGGDRVRVRLVWRALTELQPSYTVFVHLLGPGGEFWGQHDGQPVGGAYPTAYWRQGELVADEHEFTIQESVAGVGELRTGMYRLDTMERLGEAVPLQSIEVTP